MTELKWKWEYYWNLWTGAFFLNTERGEPNVNPQGMYSITKKITKTSLSHLSDCQIREGNSFKWTSPDGVSDRVGS